MIEVTDAELAELDVLMPEMAKKVREERLRIKQLEAEEDEQPVFEDQPVTPLVTESGEAFDMDTVLPPNVCPACDRGGTPRAGAPHTCGLPNPPMYERPHYGG